MVQAAEQGLEGRLPLELAEGRPQAEMLPAAEGQVLVLGTGHVEAVRFGERRRIAVDPAAAAGVGVADAAAGAGAGAGGRDWVGELPLGRMLGWLADALRQEYGERQAIDLGQPLPFPEELDC